MWGYYIQMNKETGLLTELNKEVGLLYTVELGGLFRQSWLEQPLCKEAIFRP